MKYAHTTIGRKTQTWLDTNLHITHTMGHTDNSEQVVITFHTENKVNGLTKKKSTYLVFNGQKLFMCSFPTLESAKEWATEENINELLEHMSWY
jgi:hypothetical protein